jgi:hypothetical protein
MDNLQLKSHIEDKIETKNNMHRLWERINELNLNVGLSKNTMDELQAKISSKIAQCERSIQDHEKLCKTEQAAKKFLESIR